MDELISKGIYDIIIDGYKYFWNSSTFKLWIDHPNSVNEIGSVYVIQGLEADYIGLIIGKELHYNKDLGKFYVDKDAYYDKLGKTKVIDNDELTWYILNQYKIMCTRAIKKSLVTT